MKVEMFFQKFSIPNFYSLEKNDLFENVISGIMLNYI